MNIEIPKGYKFYSNKENSTSSDLAYEKNGNLYIVGDVSFERLMYDLTYNLKKYSNCYYCNCELNENNCTLDHRYPKHFGGISIPDNLVPCCFKCNESKSDLTSQQFREYISLKPSKQKKFRKFSLEKNRRIQSIAGFILPEEWISTHKINKITTQIRLNDHYYKGKRYKKIKTFYKRHHILSRPIIISSNNVLLDGFLILMYAKNYKVSYVPTIILENVIVN